LASTEKPFTVTLDDDPMIHRIIEKTTGFPSLSFASTKKLIGRAKSMRPIAAFIDVHLDDEQLGIDIIPELRQCWPHVPIIVITGDGEEDIVSAALSAGADDFIQKPIRPRELMARMQARMKEKDRLERKSTQAFGDLILDELHNSMSNDKGETRFLSPTELNLLTCLLDAKGSVVTRADLKRRCWGKVAVSDNAVDRKLHEVRVAIKELSGVVSIKTKYGTGYQLVIA
jgi:two-component system, OmpR family, response regulator MtrA